jgi:hypothetical protein
LGILHGVHFVSRAREGLQVVYSISDPAIQALCELMCERMQRDMEGQLRRLGGQGMGVNGSAV